MEHKMRRFRQQLPDDIAKKILLRDTGGVLSLVDEDGCPYGVPMSFAYDGDRSIYFHSAVAGHKVDCIRGNPHCSFCVIDKDEVVPEEFTTYFRSVIARGDIRVLADEHEILHGLRLLCGKYSPGINPDKEIAEGLGRVLVLKMDVASLTGKEAIELVG